MIRLMVGLGNPGPEYEHTRHNAGFWWLQAAARRLEATPAFDRNHHALLARVNLPNRPQQPLWLLQPMSFMNLSGRAVAQLARFYKIEPTQILVLHDELDLPPGQVKLKQGGGAAGHNGLKDIIAQLGSPDFWRLRIGIGHPGVRAEVVDWVLRRPPVDERIGIEQCIATSLDALPLLIDGAMERATMKLHARPERPKPVPRVLPAEPAAGPSGSAGPPAVEPAP